jgi:glycosyltransferase involved in cell wall biosynthesis
MRNSYTPTKDLKPKVAWLIPELILGSGGHRTILIHAKNLEDNGYECAIYIEGNGKLAMNPAREIDKLFGLDFKRVYYGWDKVSQCDVAIATIWYSAKFVRDLKFSCKKLYFIQDYEPWFNQMGDGYILAEESYTYGLIPITIGNWLRQKLHTEFGLRSLSYNFGVDQRAYVKANSKSDPNAICMIYQPDKMRRCPILGIEALGIVKYLRPEVKIYLYGSQKISAGNIWFEHKNLGLLSVEQCNDLYGKCSIGLCLSSSNPSRIPFEMMAAGLPVVELERENNFYDLPQSCVTLAKATPEAIAQSIIYLLDNPEIRTKKSKKGINYISTMGENNELSQFKNTIDEVINNAIDYKPLPKKISGIPSDTTLPSIGPMPADHKTTPTRYPWLPLGLRRLARKLRAIWMIIK